MHNWTLGEIVFIYFVTESMVDWQIGQKQTVPPRMHRHNLYEVSEDSYLSV